MKILRTLAIASLVAAVPAAHATDADEDWKLFGGILSLVQSLVRVAATSDDPAAMQRGVDGILAGRNADANRLAGDLLDEISADMPAQMRGTVSALARDMLTIARRENARQAAQAVTTEKELAVADARAAVLQARKDLAAMGLRYYDADQYRDAVRRNDVLAMELFVAGRGIQ